MCTITSAKDIWSFVFGTERTEPSAEANVRASLTREGKGSTSTAAVNNAFRAGYVTSVALVARVESAVELLEVHRL
jgi:hypothetical protein